MAFSASVNGLVIAFALFIAICLFSPRRFDEGNASVEVNPKPCGARNVLYVIGLSSARICSFVGMMKGEFFVCAELVAVLCSVVRNVIPASFLFAALGRLYQRNDCVSVFSIVFVNWVLSRMLVLFFVALVIAFSTLSVLDPMKIWLL